MVKNTQLKPTTMEKQINALNINYQKTFNNKKKKVKEKFKTYYASDGFTDI